MPLTAKKWLVLGLLILGAGVLLWQFGGRRAGVRSPNVLTEVRDSATAPLTLTNPAVAIASVAAPTTTQPSSPVNVMASAGTVQTNPFAYRLTNTSKTVGQLLRENTGLILRNALIDTANPSQPAIPDHLRASGDPGSYIVQSRGNINKMFREDILKSGAEIVSYIPNNAMLVRASKGQANRLKSSAYVQAVLPFEPYYKLDNALLAIAVEKQLSPYGEVNVVAFPHATGAATEAIKKIGGEVVGQPERTPFGENLAVKIPARRLAELAQIREVQLIGVRVERRLMNDMARARVKVSTNTTTLPLASHYLGLGGSNVLVAITDSGVDGSHEDFQTIGGGAMRLIGLTNDLGSLGNGDQGHGTHVAGTLLGNGSQSFTVRSSNGVSFAHLSRTGTVFSGMAPSATGYVHYYNRGTDIKLQEEAALAGALINNNSWAYNNSDYDIFAASYDAAVRDSLNGITGEQQVTYVFAAGNSGGGADAGFGGRPGSILSPATGKNVISVGSSEQLRRITNLVWKCTTTTNASGGSTTTCVTNQPWLGETDSSNQVAGFSARGNVGIGREGDHGRFKPDVIAPGTFLVSCRSSNYVSPSGSISVSSTPYNFESIGPGATNLYNFGLPRDVIQLDIITRTNSATVAGTWTSLWINANMGAPPTGVPLGSNDVTLFPPAIGFGNLYFNIWNPSTNEIIFDVVIRVWLTNDVGNYWEVLRGLNDTNGPGPKYRYESGTSMSVPVVSGLLALMQEYYGKVLTVTNSPALNKALLINGARSLSSQYNLDINAPANHQGWGLVNISNSAPAGLTTGTNRPIFLIDQDPTNALATGEGHFYTITVPPRARSSPLRITLAWTDPAGNPVAGPKLVNDLDLFVDGPGIAVQGTNVLISTNRWVGNNFAGASDFTMPILLADTNIDDLIGFARDHVNNVENVYISPPLGDTYTVLVKAHRVNVNAVNSHTNGIVQDYALVVSSGNTVTTNSQISVSSRVYTNNPSPIVINMQRNGNTNHVIALLNQHVGANSPYITTTNGATNQWAFYTFTNTTTFTNVAILTFLPPNSGFLRPDPNIRPRTPRFNEGDIDLYVARSVGPLAASYFNLTNLDAAVIAGCDRSTKRGGSESIVYSDAGPNEVFYIGVKSEDQQTATFGLLAAASELPFSQRDASNNIVASAITVPVDIPDGSPDLPGGTRVIVLVNEDDAVKVQRVYLTNILTHENGGDLIGILTHTDISEQGTGEALATLNNHSYFAGTTNIVYDDSEQGDITWAIPSDGPGTLRNFVGHNASRQWLFTISDNALFHTGSVDGLTLVIEPTSTNANTPVDIVRTIGGFGWLRAPFDVTPDVTNAEICVTYVNGSGPLNLYVRRGQFPTLITYDKGEIGIIPPGDCMNLGLSDSPPLSPGRYFVGVYNDSPNPVTVQLVVRLSRSLERPPTIAFADDNIKSLLDDATTNSFIFVATQALVSAVEVDVRLNHPRASDLVLYLVNPQNTRVMLAENRGRDIAKGYGVASSNVVITNVISRVLNDGFDSAPPACCGALSLNAGTIFGGWKVINGSVDVIGEGSQLNYITAHEGPHAIDLDGNSPGTIETNVTMVTGKKYRLSYAYTADPNGFVRYANVKLLGLITNNIAYANPNGTNLQWLTTSHVFTAMSPVTTLRVESADPCCSGGVYFDTFRIEDVEIITNGALYATFTEDRSKLPVPIKFAPPPFGDTNFAGTNRLISGFEGWVTNAVIFTSGPVLAYGQTFDGWLVTSNTVCVQTNYTAFAGTNHLLLRRGTITRTVPTEPGKEYVLTFATRSSGQLIYNTGVDNDNIPLFPGELDPHYRTNGARAGTTITNAYVLSTNAMMPAWFAQTNGASRWIGVTASGTNIPPGPYTFRTTFDLRGYNTNTVALNCKFAADDAVTAVLLNGVLVAGYGGNPNGFTSLNLNNGSGAGFRQLANTLDFVLTNSLSSGAPSALGLRVEPTITGTLRSNALPRVFNSVGEIRLRGSYTNNFTALSGGWRVQAVTFVAQSNSVTLDFEGITHGVSLDHVQIRDTGRKYYLPEEPMAPLLGQQAFGNWTLQIWDSRLGMVATNAELVSWRLNLSYVRTNPPFTLLTNTQTATRPVISNSFTYFAIDVPCDGATVTNQFFDASQNVDIWFNQDTFPTGTPPGDVLLASAITGTTNVFEVGYYPLVRSGRYFIGVRNSGGTGSNSITLQVDIVCPPPDIQSFNIASTSFAPGALKMSWSSEIDAEFKVLYATDPLGPWTELPGTVTSATGEFSFTDDGSTSGGLPERRFYRLKRIK